MSTEMDPVQEAQSTAQSQDEGTRIMCELISAYYNGRSLEGTIPNLATRSRGAAKAFTHHGPALLADALVIVSFLHHPEPELLKAHEDLQNDRAKFRTAVEWLCLGENAGERSGCLKYLQDHGVDHVTKTLTLENGKLLLSVCHLHLVDLFCVFLVTECVGKHPSMMPIKICPRCRRLFSVDGLRGRARMRKEYCSAKCQESSHWTKDRTARADLRYVSRLSEEYSPADRRRRLENRKVKIRLAEIRERWMDKWPTLMHKLKQASS